MNAIAEGTRRLESTLQVGQLLEGKYRVDYLVGQGGMAAVWAGTNERTGKRVALKVLLPSLATIPGVEALFQREGLAASRVNHPNVVSVFDVIEHDGVACLVMELLDGEPLGSYLFRTGPLSAHEACSLLLPAMRGVASAHAQGVVHLDVKPQNIFICEDPDGRAVTTKVLDFGISMIVERAREPAMGPVPNVPMGTPAYMAPEHFSEAGSVDTRADVYGFGVIFYEVLTGEVPFCGEPGVELYQRILYEPVPPLAQLRPDVPASLVRVIESALAKDPAVRPNCVHRMIDAIEAAMPLVPDSGADARASWVEATVPREKTGEHQVTRFMAGFPLAGESRQRQEATGEGSAGPAQSDKPMNKVTAAPPTSPLSRTKRLLRSRRGWLWAAASLAILLAATGAAWRGLARNVGERRGDMDGQSVTAPRGAVIVSPLPPEPVESSQGELIPNPGTPILDETATSDPAPIRVRADEQSKSQSTTSRKPGVKRRKTLAGAAPRAGTLSVEDF